MESSQLNKPKHVYKITTSPPPDPIPAVYPPSELDQTDGFIHLSTAAQGCTELVWNGENDRISLTPAIGPQDCRHVFWPCVAAVGCKDTARQAHRTPYPLGRRRLRPFIRKFWRSGRRCCAKVCSAGRVVVRLLAGRNMAYLRNCNVCA